MIHPRKYSVNFSQMNFVTFIVGGVLFILPNILFGGGGGGVTLEFHTFINAHLFSLFLFVVMYVINFICGSGLAQVSLVRRLAGYCTRSLLSHRCCSFDALKLKHGIILVIYIHSILRTKYIMK